MPTHDLLFGWCITLDEGIVDACSPAVEKAPAPGKPAACSLAQQYTQICSIQLIAYKDVSADD